MKFELVNLTTNSQMKIIGIEVLELIQLRPMRKVSSF